MFSSCSVASSLILIAYLSFRLSSMVHFPVSIYLPKFNNRKTRARCEICSKLTIKAPERRQWRCYSVFIDNFEHVKVNWVCSAQYPMHVKSYIKYTIVVIHYHFCFCFTLEVEGVLFFLMVSCLHETPNDIILLYMDYEVALRLEIMEVEKSVFTVKIRGFCFLDKLLKRLRKKYSKFVWLPGKIINVTPSLSFQLYEIIIDYLFKVS